MAFVIIIIIVCIMIGQCFNPDLDKPWIKDIGQQISKVYKGDSQPVIITNGDERIGYYANAVQLNLNLNNFRIYARHSFQLKGFPHKYYKRGIQNFSENLSKIGKDNVFLFIEKTTPAKVENLFKKHNQQFPFKLIKVYKSKRKQYCLYQFK